MCQELEHIHRISGMFPSQSYTEKETDVFIYSFMLVKNIS